MPEIKDLHVSRKKDSMLSVIVSFIQDLDAFTKSIIVVFILFITITPLIVSNTFDLRQRAATSNAVIFLDTQNQAITQTATAQIRLQLTAPWGVLTAMNKVDHTMGMTMGGTQPTVLGAHTLAIPVSASIDDVNEVNGAFDKVSPTNAKTLWIGNGGVANGTSYTGFRFANVNIPKGAVITSSQVQVSTTTNQWIQVSFLIAGDNTGNSQQFSSSLLPSKRSFTSNTVSYSNNSNWLANGSYTLKDITSVIQEIVNRSDWQPGNNISIILKGTGSGAYARKYITSFDGSPIKAPTLLVSYNDAGGSVTGTPVPTQTSTPPTATPTTVPPTATNTPIPPVYITSAVVAEDSGFTKNVQNIPAFSTNPYIMNYTLSAPGTITVYVKFISNTGLTEVDQAQIVYAIPQGPTPTPLPTVAIPTPTASVTGSNPNSQAMGLWTPNPSFDTCPSYPAGVVTDQDKINYIKQIHDSYKVIGPDGKWYPTWHPAVDPATGCKFGHEHGQDPSTANIWNLVKDHYAYVNPDGTKDLAHAGIPFGYVNEQMDTWTAANNNTIAMRHEDHVGHKVSIANNFQIGLDASTTGTQFFYPGVTCNYIVKVHQGTHSKDAFENNLHEVLYNVQCSDGHTINLDTMGRFGTAGQFTRSCDSAGDRTSIIQTGFSYSNQSYPSGDIGSTRGISDRSCVETGFLVPQGQFSQNPYEFWPVSMSLIKTNGTPIADGLNLLFDVEDSIRYYYPGHIDPTSGLVDNLGHFQDLCYENLNGRTFRGSLCDNSTNYGAIKGITWDDPRAGFRGLNRGTYFKPGVTHNAGGQTTWYSDPFGNNAQTTPFPGSLKQYVSADSINYATKANAFETANVINMVHDDGHGTVHAPN